jgi:hypothetical protein
MTSLELATTDLIEHRSKSMFKIFFNVACRQAYVYALLLIVVYVAFANIYAPFGAK